MIARESKRKSTRNKAQNNLIFILSSNFLDLQVDHGQKSLLFVTKYPINCGTFALCHFFRDFN